MAHWTLTGEQAEEYIQLYAEYVAATARAGAVLKTKGLDSEEFKQADAEVGELWRRLRMLQGMTGKDWGA